MRQTIGMNVGGTVPTKIIVNGTTLDKCKVNTTDLIKTYAQLTLNISFYVECSASSDDESRGCTVTIPADTTMYINGIKTSWTASGDKTISSISIAPVVELKENDCNAVTTTYGTRVQVTSGQRIVPSATTTSAASYQEYIDFRCQLKSQSITINFSDGTSLTKTLNASSVQSSRQKIDNSGHAYANFTISYSATYEWEI